MRISRSVVFACAGLFSGTSDLFAQVWLPGGLTGPGNQSQTSNWRGGRRHQMVFAPAAVPPLGGAIQALVLRSDDVQSAGPVQLDIAVLVSSVGVPPIGNVDPASYANNLGTDATVVVPTTRVSLPGGTSATFTLPFVQPFPYQNGNPLLIQIDFNTFAQTNPNPVWMLDTHDLPLTFWGLVDTTTGTGCPVGGQWTVFSDGLADRFVFRWGTTVLAGSPPGFLMLGTNNRSFGGAQLPLSLAILGAPGCALRTSIETVYSTPMALGGGFSWYLTNVEVPRDARFLGADVHAQYLVLDPTANAAGFRMSELQSEHLAVAPAPLLTMHLYGPFVPNLTLSPDLAARNNSIVLGLQ
jgi:hypothetical protein